MVLPHCYLGNLVQSRISGSESVSVANGKTSPGRGYRALRSWLEFHETEPLQYEKLTIDIFFENIGKYIIKNPGISNEKITTTDIIATCKQIVIDEKLTVQFKKAKILSRKIQQLET